jgi:nucleoside-diphosphate-sugar epimerase
MKTLLMIMVTGASGFVGRPIVARLLKRGYKVRALCISREELAKVPKGAQPAIGDITRPQTLISAVKDVDTVIHLAGMVSYTKPREELFRVNAIGTRNLIGLCKSVKKFIFASSVSVYGEIEGQADEDYPLGPETSYGESKLTAEKYIMGSGVPYVILRMAPVYGAGSPDWKRNLRLLERGFPVPNTKNLTHVTHIDNAVQAFVLAVEKGRGVYNIADPRPVPFVEFAETVMRSLGRKPRKMPVFLVKLIAKAMGMGAYLGVLTMNRSYVIRKAEKELGYTPESDLKARVRRMVEWYKSSS